MMGWPLFHSMELLSSTPDLHLKERDAGMATPRIYQTKTWWDGSSSYVWEKRKCWMATPLSRKKIENKEMGAWPLLVFTREREMMGFLLLLSVIEEGLVERALPAVYRREREMVLVVPSVY